MTTTPDAPEFVEGELVPYEPPAAPGLFGTDDPNLVIARAVEISDVLARVIRDRKLSTRISGKEHVLVEGWTLLGSMLGVFPVTTWTRPLEDGWEARVEARTLTGALVGAAESECLRSERRWAKADDYALRSMATTRATSKALRMPLGFVMQLAGFDATPADEVTGPEPEPERKIPPEARPPREQVDRIGELLRLLEQADPDTDWKQRARELAGVSGIMLTKGVATGLIRQLEAELEQRQADSSTVIGRR